MFTLDLHVDRNVEIGRLCDICAEFGATFYVKQLNVSNGGNPELVFEFENEELAAAFDRKYFGVYYK